MPSSIVTVDGFPATVDVSGPEQGSVVVVLGAANQGPAAYEAVCQRLHTASLRTIVIGPDPRLSAFDVLNDHRNVAAGRFARFALNPKARLKQ